MDTRALHTPPIHHTAAAALVAAEYTKKKEMMMMTPASIKEAAASAGLTKSKTQKVEQLGQLLFALKSAEIPTGGYLIDQRHHMAETYHLLRNKCVTPLLVFLASDKFIASLSSSSSGGGDLSFATTIPLLYSSLRSLVDQLTRSATSVTANLMEGTGKATFESMHMFVRIARGSLWETLDHLESLVALLSHMDTSPSSSSDAPEASSLILLNTLKCAWHEAARLFDEQYIALLEYGIMSTTTTNSSSSGK